MQPGRRFRGVRSFIAMLLVASIVSVPIIQAQTTPPGQPPARQDATRPPGAPRPSPQAPPSSTTEGPLATPRDPAGPPNTTAPSPGTQNPAVPIQNQQQQPSSGAPPNQTPANPQTDQPLDMQQFTKDPTITSLEARPVPPPPPMTRLGVSGDNSLSLTLNESIRLALENNNDIEVARNDVRFAETQLRSLQGFYDPVFVLTPQVTRSTRPVTSVLAGGNQAGTLSQTDFELNPGINKNFEIGGGQYQFFYNNLRQNTTSTFSNLNPIYSSSLGATFTQPLLRDRSIDRQRREIRVQRKRVEQSDADFRRLTTETIARVQAAYWDLVFALREQENRLSGLNLVRQQFRLTEARVAAGAAAPLERAEVQTELAGRESDLLAATRQVSIAENTLKQLILRDPLAKEWSATVTPTDEPTFDTAPVNLAGALTEARANRQELRRLRLQNEITDIDVKFFKNQTKPRIDIQSTLSTNGLAGTAIAASGIGGIVPGTTTGTGVVPIITGDPTVNASAFLLQQINQLRTLQGLTAAVVPSVAVDPGQTIPPNLIGSYGRATRNLFGFDTGTISVGVSLQIPLRNRTAEANLAGALVQRTQLEASTRAQEQAVEVEVRNAAQSVETARQVVLSARAQRQNAELQLAGERRLFQVGRSTTFLVFQRENQLTQSRALELRAQTDYNKALAELQRVTSTTLRLNNVVVETPTIK